MADSKTAALERISGIFDAGSFIEIGACITGRSAAGTPASMDGDGVVTGYGTVNGRLVYVYAQNASSSVGEMHAKKISSIYNMALNMGAPVIAVVDCAGVRIEEGNDSLFSFGKIFAHQAKASGIIPQISMIYGNCGGGMAVAASMSDFVLMEKNAKLFVQSPNAVAGNFEEKCDTASAEFNAKETGICDFLGTAAEISEKVRELISFLPQNNEEDFSSEICEDDLNRSVAGIDSLKTKSEFLMQIADDGKFLEVKAEHAKSMTTGFIRLNGHTVGTVANNKQHFCHMGIKKAVKFLRFCDAFNIPVLTVADVRSFGKSKDNETALARALGKLTYTYSELTVPSVTVVAGEVYGTAGLVMGSKALGTDLVYAFSNAKMGIMEKSLLDGLTDVNKDRDVYSALYNAERGYVDDIIDPSETRQRLAAAYEMLYTKSVQVLPRKHGTV